MLCVYCNEKFQMTTERQCQTCSSKVHKACEEKFNDEHSCKNRSIDSNSITDNSINHINTNQMIISTANRLFHGFGNLKSNFILPNDRLNGKFYVEKNSSFIKLFSSNIMEIKKSCFICF